MQENVWEKEYRSPKLISLSNIPAQCVKDFMRFLRKEQRIDFNNLNILDLGCGNAKNSSYIYEQGENNNIYGIDISETAINYAKSILKNGSFIKQSIGSNLPYKENFFDIVLDITSSNSLNESERSIYINEVFRVLKSDGFLLLRTLCKDGDKNAQNLIKTNPGKEKDTYIMPELGLIERVFSKEDLINLYSEKFEMISLDKETHYTKFNGKSYKRNFWISIWKKVIKS